MKFQSRMLPSYILLTALVWGALCTVVLLVSDGDSRGASDMIALTAISGLLVFPYSLNGFVTLFGFRFFFWDPHSVIFTWGCSLLIGLMAIAIGWGGYRLNRRWGPRAGWMFLALLAVLGPLTIALVFIAADYVYPNTLPGLFRA